MKKNITYIICSFLLPLQLWSQVGIGTSNPIGAFHIDGASNSDASDSSTLTDDVVLLPNGNLGVGNASPKVKLDVRGKTNSSAIGLGNPTDTELTAANAKEGAIKYYYTSDTDKGIKYSNGSTCIKRPSTDIKALVFANKNSSQIINASTTTSITGWTESADRTDSFASGVFTAPRDGVYIATFNIALTNQAISNDSRLKLILISNTTTGVPTYKCVYSFPGTGTGTVSNIVSGSCTGVFYLAKNNTITPQVYQNTGAGNSRTILNDASYNTLSIIEK